LTFNLFIIIAGIEEFPTENSDDVLLYGDLFYDLLNEEQREKVNLRRDFGTVTLNINNIPINYSCSFDNKHVDGPKCIKVDIQFYNHTLAIDNSSVARHTNEIIYTEDYLIYRTIFGACDHGNIYVYDKNHNLLTTIDNVNGSYKDSNGNSVFDSFRLVGDILYFITADWSYPGGCTADITYLSYVDLTNGTYTVHNIEKID